MFRTILFIVLILIFFNITIVYSQKNNIDQMSKDEQIRFLLDKLEEHEAKFKQYEAKNKKLQQQLQNLQKQILSNEESSNEQNQELYEEVTDLLEETHNEVIKERTVGLLSEYLGNSFFHISGYYRFEYMQDDLKNSPGNFRVHEVTFFFQKQIHDLNFFTELEFEDAPDIEGNGITIDGSGKLKIEQVWLEYLIHPLFNIRAGFMLTPEHCNLNHYPTTTFSTTDPLHQSKIFPKDYAGLLFYGDSQYITDEDWGFGYQLYISNGEGNNKASHDNNENKALGGKIILHLPHFNFFEIFDIAGNMYYGKNENNDQDFLWNIEFLMSAWDFDFKFEYAQGRRDFKAQGVSLRKNYGGYVEMAYTIKNQYTIFQRFEIFDEDRRNDSLIRRYVFGFQYQPWPEVSFKGEYFYEWEKNGEDFNGIAFSIVTLL